MSTAEPTDPQSDKSVCANCGGAVYRTLLEHMGPTRTYWRHQANGYNVCPPATTGWPDDAMTASTERTLCERCQGLGYRGGDERDRECPECGGTGVLPYTPPDGQPWWTT